MDQSGAAPGYPSKANEAMHQPPPPQTGGPPPPYSFQPYPGVPPNSGYVQSPPPGQPGPPPGQPGYVQPTYPGQPAPQNPGYVQPPYPGQPAPLQPGVQCGYPATTVVVSQPGVVTRIPVQPPPRSHMVVSVIGCLCCLWPLGIGAIIASFHVQSAIARGDIASAKSSSKTAKIVNIINFLLGFIIILTVSVLFSSVNTSRRIRY